MKKTILVALMGLITVVVFGQDKKTKDQKKEERKQRINQLIKQEEEGALIFSKQGAFGIKLNTDGYGIFYEHGKYKTITRTDIWWMELGEHQSNKQEKRTNSLGGYYIGNPYVFGKQNNLYQFKLGLGQQRLIGGKGNKNGVAVSAVYGGGLIAGMLKPYYLSVYYPNEGVSKDIRYTDDPVSFLDPTLIDGASGLFKGFGKIKFVPGIHARAALRFDYGRFNELLSAIEIGVNAEYYTQNMPIMVGDTDKKFFFNGYVALVFGKRK
ncbi:hypothetical protein SAMN05421788_108106 [Filimonas lacunae]|uniref:Outer membrane protein beta-barrel domain-containing protein n=1 Tax=Filimonas lacunae TaxID=477680 RepID=A0A1N7R0T0_9BACT|nr:hypothetical protein [Filimonas lacunae]SIT28721.1 hypothetical protein SAMN05421788_108106 [Filimonas lacunae]